MKLPLVDTKGKEFGFLLITDEAWKILELTGVTMLIEVDATKDEVVGLLC